MTDTSGCMIVWVMIHNPRAVGHGAETSEESSFSSPVNNICTV